MKSSTLIGFILLVLVQSCSLAQTEAKRASAFYTAITVEMSSNKTTWTNFFDQLILATDAVIDKPNATADIQALEKNLALAKAANLEQKAHIEQIEAFDTEINLKQKALDYIWAFDQAFEHEFPKAIQIFSVKSADRYDKAHTLVMETFKAIKEKEVAYKAAQAAFKEKYKL
jgi:hypothetical protein